MADEPLPYTGPLITRAAALAQSLKRYFTGKPCSHGHIAQRKCRSSHCVMCRNLSQKEKRANQPFSKARLRMAREDARAKGLEFYFTGKPCKHGHIGLRYVSSGVCLECRTQYNRNYYETNPEYWRTWVQNNPEKVLAASRRAYAKNPRMGWTPESREKYSTDTPYYKTTYYLANRDKILQRSRAHYLANQDKLKARNRTYLKTPRGKAVARAGRVNRRARVRNAKGSVSSKAILEILKSQKHRCANPRCRANLKTVRYHIDHIIPLSRGGTHERRNLQALCQPCNNRKHAKDPLEWARENGLLL
jgi:5-methylcytosine-specific restriction endonuclease McrA